MFEIQMKFFCENLKWQDLTLMNLKKREKKTFTLLLKLVI